MGIVLVSNRYRFPEPILQGKRKRNDEAENVPPPKRQRRHVHDEPKQNSGDLTDGDYEPLKPVLFSVILVVYNLIIYLF
jgi:hypothetical protein